MYELKDPLPEKNLPLRYVYEKMKSEETKSPHTMVFIYKLLRK